VTALLLNLTAHACRVFGRVCLAIESNLPQRIAPQRTWLECSRLHRSLGRTTIGSELWIATNQPLACTRRARQLGARRPRAAVGRPRAARWRLPDPA
jgi:hypothetical protein